MVSHEAEKIFKVFAVLIGRRLDFFNVYHRKRIIFMVCYWHDPNPL